MGNQRDLGWPSTKEDARIFQILIYRVGFNFYCLVFLHVGDCKLKWWNHALKLYELLNQCMVNKLLLSLFYDLLLWAKMEKKSFNNLYEFYGLSFGQWSVKELRFSSRTLARWKTLKVAHASFSIEFSTLNFDLNITLKENVQRKFLNANLMRIKFWIHCEFLKPFRSDL